MSKRLQLLIMLFTVISITAAAQTPSVPASPAPSAKEAVLKKLWTYYASDFADYVIKRYKVRMNKHPNKAVLEDPKFSQTLRAKFYERFAAQYSAALSLEELVYLDQLYSTSLMTRVNDADQKIWKQDEYWKLSDTVFNEIAKKSPLTPAATSEAKAIVLPSIPAAPVTSSVPAPLYPKTAPRK